MTTSQCNQCKRYISSAERPEPSRRNDKNTCKHVQYKPYKTCMPCDGRTHTRLTYRTGCNNYTHDILNITNSIVNVHLPFSTTCDTWLLLPQYDHNHFANILWRQGCPDDWLSNNRRRSRRRYLEQEKRYWTSLTSQKHVKLLCFQIIRLTMNFLLASQNPLITK